MFLIEMQINYLISMLPPKYDYHDTKLPNTFTSNFTIMVVIYFPQYNYMVKNNLSINFKQK